MSFRDAFEEPTGGGVGQPSNHQEPVVLGLPEADMTIEMGSPLIFADNGDLITVLVNESGVLV